MIPSIRQLLPVWETIVEQTIFVICMFFGVAAVTLIAATLLMIVLGRVDV